MSEIELAQPVSTLPSTREWDTMLSMANAIAKTEFVPKGLRGKADATLAAIMFGREIGLPPMVAMSSVHIIEGHPTMSAALLLALIRKSGGKIIRSSSTAEGASITGQRPDGEETTVNYTIEEARAAGLAGKDNWKKYPADMLWARCVSRLYRRLFSDAAFGATIYAPEDFDQRDVEAESTFTDEQIAETGVMMGIEGFVPRPKEGEYFSELVKKELLGKVMRERNLPAWKECTPTQQQEAIVLAKGLLEIAEAKLALVIPDEEDYTFEQAQAILNLVRDGTVPATEGEGETVAPDPPSGAVVPDEVIPPAPTKVAEALEEQRWKELYELLAGDMGTGTNAAIEAATRKLYRLMGQLGLWPEDQLHKDLAPREHYADLGRKEAYAKFGRGAQVLAKQAVARVGL